MPLFQPEKMVRVEIDFPDRLMMEVTKVISSLGYFQIEDMSMMDLRKKPSDDQKTTVIQTKLTNLETLLTALQAKLGLQSSRETEKGLELIEDPSIIEGEISSLSEQVENLGAKIEATRQAIESKKATLKLLLPFKDLPYDLGAIRNRRYLYSILGTMPTNRIERFRSSLSQIPYVLLEEPRANNRSQVLLLGPRNQRDFLILTARSAYLDPLEIDESEHGLLADMTSNLAVKVDELEKELKNLETERKQLSGSNAEKITDWLRQVQYSSKIYDIIGKYGHLRNSNFMVGWVPAKRKAEFLDLLHSLDPDILETVEDTSEMEDELTPPVSSEVPFQLRGFQKLVNTYSTPGYKELDPTLLLSITFPLLFGTMFGDLGQGAVLALLGLVIASKKIKPLRRLSPLGWVISACGLVSMVFGVLYGSVFGFEDLLPAVWISPLHDILRLLIITIAGGAVILSLANILGIVNAAIRKDWVGMIFGGKGIAGLLLYWSLIGIVLNATMANFPIPKAVLVAIAVAAVLMIIASEAVHHLAEGKRPIFKGGFLLYFITAFFELFEMLISYLSNSLSYVRVGAFAVAHAGLSQVVMILASMVGKGIGYWIVIVLGNLFIIGFEGMIVSIQTLRLEYYEFFSKFFRGGGVRYQPLSLSGNTEIRSKTK